MRNPPSFPPHTNDVHLSAGERSGVDLDLVFSAAEVTHLTLSECCGMAQGACPHPLCHGMCFLAKGTQTFAMV